VVLREIRSEEYVLPVGVWQIREGVRQAFTDRTNAKREFESLERAYEYASSSLSVSQNEWRSNSKIYRNLKRSQSRLTDFFSSTCS
jgi:DNA repair protein NreA